MSDQPTFAPLSVLGYREDGEWVALCLEMDLRGYGKTLDEARDELDELATLQLRFARFKGQPELVWKPAEPMYWRLFDGALREQVRALASAKQPPENGNYTARGLTLPPSHVLDQLSRFSPANA